MMGEGNKEGMHIEERDKREGTLPFMTPFLFPFIRLSFDKNQ
jgi:hypothetical protein